MTTCTSGINTSDVLSNRSTTNPQSKQFLILLIFNGRWQTKLERCITATHWKECGAHHKINDLNSIDQISSFVEFKELFNFLVSDG